MNDNLRKVSCLTYALYRIDKWQSKNKSKGRLKNLIAKFDKAIVKELGRCKKFGDNEKYKMLKAFDEFDRKTGWACKDRHLLTYCSFIAAMFEGLGLEKMTSHITEIVDYFERNATRGMINSFQMCHSGGFTAAEKWESIMSQGVVVCGNIKQNADVN